MDRDVVVVANSKSVKLVLRYEGSRVGWIHFSAETVTVLGSFRGTALIVEAGLTGGYLPARVQPLSSRGCQDTLSRTQK
jgi:hypothetical protein